jgi:uncharacterized oxidoreductase
MRKFAGKVFEACGSPPAEASIVADHLLTSNLMGFDSHGVIRIPEYVALVRKGDLCPGAPKSLSAIGATSPSRWHCWHFAWKIRAISLE